MILDCELYIHLIGILVLRLYTLGQGISDGRPTGGRCILWLPFRWRRCRGICSENFCNKHINTVFSLKSVRLPSRNKNSSARRTAVTTELCISQQSAPTMQWACQGLYAVQLCAYPYPLASDQPVLVF